MFRSPAGFFQCWKYDININKNINTNINININKETGQNKSKYCII